MSQFYYRETEHAPYGVCGICGCDTLVTRPEHNSAVHEVYYYENHGLYAVTYAAREHVAEWASGKKPLPTHEEFVANAEAWNEAHADIPFSELIKQQDALYPQP